MEKENKFAGVFKQMDIEREKAEVDYVRIMKEDKIKNFMDILPADFKKTKRSPIKRTILLYIDKVTGLLNSCGLYDGRVFDKKEVVRFMMRGEKYSNFYLAHKFVPKKYDSSSLWFSYVNKHKKGDEDNYDELYEKFREENKELLVVYDELSHTIQCMSQCWEQYEDRQKIKDKKLVNDYDIEEDGFPRTGRGNMCYLFVPVKGKFPKNAKGSLTLFNPRIKKSVTYTKLKYKAEDNIYSCLNEKGKKVFLADHSEIKDSYNCLFASNKEIYSGWWNRTMILKS